MATTPHLSRSETVERPAKSASSADRRADHIAASVMGFKKRLSCCGTSCGDRGPHDHSPASRGVSYAHRGAIRLHAPLISS